MLPDLEEAVMWQTEAAFIDDGSEYLGPVVIERRISFTTGVEIKVRDIKLPHVQYLDSLGQLSLHRFYKCVEIIG